MFEAWVAGVFYFVLNGKSEELEDGESEGEVDGYEGSDESEEAHGVAMNVVEAGDGLSELGSPEEGEEGGKVDLGALTDCGRKLVEDVEVEGAVSAAVLTTELIVSNPTQHPTATTPDPPSEIQVAETQASIPLETPIPTGDTDSIEHKSPITASSIEEPEDIPISPTSNPSESKVTVTSAYQEFSVITNQNLKYRWFAMIALDDWLRPLFTPIAHYALAELRKEQSRIAKANSALSPEVIAEDLLALGAGAVLNSHVGHGKNGTIKYDIKEIESGWKVVCTFVQADGTVL